MSKRHDMNARAASAEQVLRNAEFSKAFSTMRDGIVSKLETIELDGSKEAADAVMAEVYKLQAATDVRRTLVGLMRRARPATDESDTTVSPKV